MRTKGRGNIFKDPKKLEEMLAYRNAGYSYPQLAAYYECDHTTIMYHVERAGLIRIGRRKRNDIVQLVKAGKTIREVAEMFSLPQSIISSQCCRAGIKGHKIYSNGKKLVLKLPHFTEREKRKGPTYTKNAAYIPHPKPGFVSDGVGGWITESKSIEEITRNQEQRRRLVDAKRNQERLLY